MCLKIQIELQPALQAGLMKLGRKILQVLADCRIIIGGENQFLNEELSGFRSIGNTVKTQNEAIGRRIDVYNTIGQAGLL